jgi:hypothetical protein
MIRIRLIYQIINKDAPRRDFRAEMADEDDKLALPGRYLQSR